MLSDGKHVGRVQFFFKGVYTVMLHDKILSLSIDDT